MVDFATKSDSANEVAQLADRASLADFLRSRLGYIGFREVRASTDDERRAVAAARITDAQLALIERESEPMD